MVQGQNLRRSLRHFPRRPAPALLRDGRISVGIPATGGAWTAISELPFLKAAALWGQGDTWSAGGMFLSSNSFWLEADDKTFLIRDNSGLRRETYRPKLPYESRLGRDGWVIKKRSASDPILEKTIRGVGFCAELAGTAPANWSKRGNPSGRFLNGNGPSGTAGDWHGPKAASYAPLESGPINSAPSIPCTTSTACCLRASPPPVVEPAPRSLFLSTPDDRAVAQAVMPAVSRSLDISSFS